jgi:hypothetical protein
MIYVEGVEQVANIRNKHEWRTTLMSLSILQQRFCHEISHSLSPFFFLQISAFLATAASRRKPGGGGGPTPVSSICRISLVRLDKGGVTSLIYTTGILFYLGADN